MIGKQNQNATPAKMCATGGTKMSYQHATDPTWQYGKETIDRQRWVLENAVAFHKNQ
jgi:hypothetical protein